MTSFPVCDVTLHLRYVTPVICEEKTVNNSKMLRDRGCVNKTLRGSRGWYSSGNIFSIRRCLLKAVKFSRNIIKISYTKSGSGFKGKIFSQLSDASVAFENVKS
jgi:hypothetical protein